MTLILLLTKLHDHTEGVEGLQPSSGGECSQDQNKQQFY